MFKPNLNSHLMNEFIDAQTDIEGHQEGFQAGF